MAANAVRSLQGNDRSRGGEGLCHADAEIDGQMIGGRGAIDEDVLPVEACDTGTRRRIHLIQVAAKFLRDTAT